MLDIYSYFNKKTQLYAVDLSRPIVTYTNPKVIQEIKFIGDLDRDGLTILRTIIGQSKDTLSDFSRDTGRI